MARKKRKIIQISAAMALSAPVVYALCDDGTLWACVSDWASGFVWVRVSGVPQSSDVSSD